MKKIHALIIILAILMLDIPGATAQNLFVISNETTPGSEFDTLVMQDTGDTTLYGTFTLSDGTSPFTLPNNDGASGQILATDGAGAVTWQSITEDHFTSSLVFDDGDVINLSGIDGSGSAEGLILPQNTDVSAATTAGQITWDSDDNTLYVGNGTGVTAIGAGSAEFIRTGTAVHNSTDTANDDFVFGSTQLDDDSGTSDDNYRMFFDKSKGAFRAGNADGDEWDEANLGHISTAIGSQTTASGDYSFAAGNSATASGDYSTAIGLGTSASGHFSTAMGAYTTASKQFATAMGFNTDAGGDYSTAMGEGTTAASYAEAVFGANNTDYSPNGTNSWDEADRLFVIGNGTAAGSKSDALVVLKNGDFILGSYQLDDTGTGQEDTRLFFNKNKGVFRVGSVDGTQWDDANTGNDSIAMGYNTTAGGEGSTAMGLGSSAGGEGSLAMGYNSSASGEGSTAIGYGSSASEYASTAMGYETTASGFYSTAMGRGTTADGYDSTAMGWSTSAGGDGSTAMGSATSAGGEYSTAMGRNAIAGHQGSFVWADSTNSDFNSTAVNEFSARATGGVRFITGSSGLSGVTLTAGGSSWSTVSDRNAKENFEPADTRGVLEALADIPMETWNYKSQDDAIRHMGPMAQDFHAAFGLGKDDKTITTADADGVALAAIQGLHELVKEQQAVNDEQKAMIEEQQALLEEQQTEIGRLKEILCELKSDGEICP